MTVTTTKIEREMKKQETSIDIMLHIYAAEVHHACAVRAQLEEVHDKMFHRLELSDEDADAMHAAMAAVLEKHNKSVAVRAELFALLYLCQPEALFKRMRLSQSVIRYASRLLTLDTANTSAYKKDLSFIYFNDKKFRAAARLSIEAARPIVSNKNTTTK